MEMFVLGLQYWFYNICVSMAKTFLNIDTQNVCMILLCNKIVSKLYSLVVYLYLCFS